jgi:uncharacterized protein YbjT (DUF2867 family)
MAGASGLVGRNLLSELIEDSRCTQVTAIVRSKFDLKHPKLKIQLIDYEQLLKEGIELPYSTVAICCLGTTIAKAGSESEFYKVDHDYVIAFAKACLVAGVKKFIYVSALGADANSSVFYSKTKGQVENDLRSLKFERLIILQPSLLLGDRNESRPLEYIAQKISYVLGPLLLGGLKMYKPVEAKQVARKIKTLALAEQSVQKGVQMISNAEIQI